MVNPALLQQVLDLPDEDRAELRDHLDASLDAKATISPGLRALLDQRMEAALAHPEGSIPWDDAMRQVRERYAE
ncbi:addiction module protein [Nocardioides sp.]|uniref:addiction module protein n=1 Tax=Nocardioides sp. TaxID=35761 RepID=UPI0039E408D5